MIRFPISLPLDWRARLRGMDAAPLVPPRAPNLLNLRSDPFERAAQEAGDYDKWFIELLFVL